MIINTSTLNTTTSIPDILTESVSINIFEKIQFLFLFSLCPFTFKRASSCFNYIDSKFANNIKTEHFDKINHDTNNTIYMIFLSIVISISLALILISYLEKSFIQNRFLRFIINFVKFLLTACTLVSTFGIFLEYDYSSQNRCIDALQNLLPFTKIFFDMSKKLLEHVFKFIKNHFKNLLISWFILSSITTILSLTLFLLTIFGKINANKNMIFLLFLALFISMLINIKISFELKNINNDIDQILSNDEEELKKYIKKSFSMHLILLIMNIISCVAIFGIIIYNSFSDISMVDNWPSTIMQIICIIYMFIFLIQCVENKSFKMDLSTLADFDDSIYKKLKPMGLLLLDKKVLALRNINYKKNEYNDKKKEIDDKYHDKIIEYEFLKFISNHEQLFGFTKLILIAFFLNIILNNRIVSIILFSIIILYQLLVFLAFFKKIEKLKSIFHYTQYITNKTVGLSVLSFILTIILVFLKRTERIQMNNLTILILNSLTFLVLIHDTWFFHLVTLPKAWIQSFCTITNKLFNKNVQVDEYKPMQEDEVFNTKIFDILSFMPFTFMILSLFSFILISLL